jgi:hypothetical protein
VAADVPPDAAGSGAAAPGPGAGVSGRPAGAGAPEPSALDEVVEDAGRQRLAAYYLYSALLAGVIGDGDLAPSRWPRRLAGPMERLGLTRFAPRTARGLDAQLNQAEQAARRRPDRQSGFAWLLADLINRGAFGPLCGQADKVRLAGQDGRGATVLELVKDGRVVGTCSVQDHWELVAQYLAGMHAAGPVVGTVTAPGWQSAVARQVKESGIAHVVTVGATLAVPFYPLGVAAGLGTRLVRSRIRAGRDEAETFRRVGQELAALRGQAEAELDALGIGQEPGPPA